MANSFPIIYTGKGTAPQFPKDTGRSSERLSDFITQAEMLKYNTFRQNEQEFLKSSQIDPQFFISKANQETQTNLLNNFNQRWSQRMKEANYNLSTDDKMKMQAEKNLIIGQQNEMLADQKKWEEHKALVDADVSGQYYDKEKFYNQNTKQLFEGGSYKGMTIPIKSKSFAGLLRTAGGGLGAKQTVDIQKEDGRVWSTRVNLRDEGINPATGLANNPNDEVSNFIREQAMSANDQYAQGMLEDWDNQDEAEKSKWFIDEDKSGDIDPQEEKNGIIRWAINNPKYRNAAVVTYDTAGSNISKDRTSGGLTFTLDMFGKPSTRYAPQSATTTRLGQTNYGVYHPFDNIPVGDIPVGTEIRVLNPEGEEKIIPNTTVTVDLTGYDEEKDEYTFIVTKDFEGLYEGVNILKQGKDWRIAIKRKDLPERFSGLRILKDGKPVEIGGLVGATQSPIGELDNLGEESTREKMKVH